MNPEPCPSPPAVPRPAASLILWRRDDDGLRVLMGRRSAGHRFMPGCLVFPGGRVDPDDSHARPSSDLPPNVADAIQGHGLAKVGGPSARAFAVAVARELQEETGLVLNAGDMSGGAGAELSTLRYLGRATTPAWSPIRFDARFFVAPATAARGEAGDSEELQDVGWYPADVTGAAVAPITAKVLSAFCHAMALDAFGDWPPPARFGADD